MTATSVFEAGIVAFAVCLVTGLPGDWALRQASGAVGAVLVAVTAAGIIGAVAIVSAAGWLHGFWPSSADTPVTPAAAPPHRPPFLAARPSRTPSASSPPTS